MRYQLLISAGAKEDMQQCRDTDRYAAAKLSVLLRELHDDWRACEALVDERFQDDRIESVAPLWSLQDKRINAYRIRLVDVAKWRLITAVDHASRRVALLAVMRRDEDYESNSGLWSRIEREYDGYGFCRY